MTADRPTQRPEESAEDVYEPVATEELEALVNDDAAGLPKEAVVASQRFLAGKLLEAQATLAGFYDRFKAEFPETFHADDPVARVVGEALRAAKRASDKGS
jgi:hypothetical protein